MITSIIFNAIALFIYGQWMYERGRRIERTIKQIHHLNLKWGGK